MAFATTVVQTKHLRATVGKWTSTEGDAAGTIAVEGGFVVAAIFTSIDSSGNVQTHHPRWSESVSDNITTITVYHQETVTDGRFIIIH